MDNRVVPGEPSGEPGSGGMAVSVTVGLRGRLDADHHDTLQAMLADVVGWRPDRVLVDLSLVSSVDDGSLDALAHARDEQRDRDADLFVLSPSPPCADALGAAGLTDLVLERQPAAPPRHRPPRWRDGHLGQVVVEAAKGMIAERLGVDIAGADVVLAGYAATAGRPVPEVAVAVTHGVLDIAWVERGAGTAREAPPTVVPQVLYIEDHPVNVKVMEGVFALWPHLHLDSVMTARAGLERIRRQCPDLVLLDGNLPDLDGSEVLRRIRADPATEALPVVVVSADANPARAAQLLALGADEYVVKPFDVDQLGLLVAELTATPAARRRTAAGQAP
jgi:CheY-like chemotaxis protein/anti-anti-sigma regulatory factor